MTPSFAALRLGYAPWRLKLCQESLWEPKVTDILEVHDPLDEIDSALPALACRMLGTQREVIAEIVNRIRLRHRTAADLHVDRWFGLLGEPAGNRHEQYLEYLRRDEIVRTFRSWQKEDRQDLHDSLQGVIGGDRRLEGYFEIGDRIGCTMDGLAHGRISVPLPEGQWRQVVSGITKLPLREQRAIERFLPAGLAQESPLVLVLARAITRLGRFLATHDELLTERPHWDGKTLSYRGKAAQIKSQKNGVIGIILDAGERVGWTDPFSFVLPPDLDQRSVTDAVHHFNHSHRVVRLTVNGTTVSWHEPVPTSSE